MFSGFLAGFLKVAAIAVVTGGLAGGVIWAANVGGGDDDSPLLQSEVTQTVLPPTVTPAQPTPSPQPGTPPAIDTSAWLTYDSPHGFSFDYPADWTLQEAEIGCCVPPGVEVPTIIDLMNSVYLEAREPREFLPPPGSAILHIHVNPDREDQGNSAETIIRDCESAETEPALVRFEGPPEVAERTITAGRPAIVCRGADVLSDGRARPILVQWIELASGLTLVINVGLFENPSPEDSTVEAILASLEVGSQ